MGLRLIVLALTTVLGLGCFIFDELDSAKDLMDNPSFSDKREKRPDAPKQLQAAPEDAPKKDQADRPSVGEWWKKTRSLTSGEVSAELVSCELGGARQFMRRPDCLARGGTPRRAGG